MDELAETLSAVPGLGRVSRVLTGEELGQKAARLADRALDEGMRMLDEGTDANRLRLITAIASHPLRRMQTDNSKQFEAMQRLLDQILLGEEFEEDDDLIEEDVMT